MSSCFKNLIFCTLCVWLVACGTDTSSGEQSSTSSSSATSGLGTSSNDVTMTNSSGVSTQARPGFSLRITDAPVDDLVKVVLTFIAVELLTDNGTESVKFAYKNPQTIDLLQLRGVKTASLLDKVSLPAGEYKEIRLMVDDAAMANFVELSSGGVQELKIPGGSSTGLKLKADVSVSSSRDSAFTIDFDLRQSLVMAGASGKYLLKPVTRIINDSNMGHLSGTVDQSLLLATSCSDSNVDTFNGVYIYSGHDIIPGDINQSSTRSNVPIATSNVSYDAQSDSYFYEAAFLPAGNYTIALTCNTDVDDLEVDDDLKFFNVKNVVVLVNNTIFL